jgi:hypothetical protein
VFEPQALPAADTQNVPGPVKICVLKLPDVLTVPPVATTNDALDPVSAKVD